MRFTFLGTASAFAYPEPFCRCENCQKARKAGGKSLRKRSAALINDDLLIDLGPDIVSASQIHNTPLINLQYCLQTHPHSDHLDLSNLLSRNLNFGNVGAPLLHYYASSATLEHADETFQRDLSEYGIFDPRAEEELNLKLHRVETMQPFKVGPYQVTAFPANHAPGIGALLYAIEHNGSSVFYGTDTDSLSEETWQAFHQLNLKFDLVVLDHTNGSNQPGFGHLNADLVIKHSKRMREEGILKKNGEVYATHIAHGGNPIHAELDEFAKQNGYQAAYDGLVITL
ncbi:MAG: MBL fold metallo-hydrolase [Chloroflexota bacterium]